MCEIQNCYRSSYDLPTLKSRSRWKLAVKSGSTASWSAGVRVTRRGMYRAAFYSYQTSLIMCNRALDAHGKNNSLCKMTKSHFFVSVFKKNKKQK